MKTDEYQALAMRTSPDGHDRILNGCMGLIGETGEIVDLVKKWKFQSGDNAELPKDKLIDECGDVLWYCAELATGLNENLTALFTQKNFFFDDLREINEETPLEITVLRLAAMAARPAMYLFDGLPVEIRNLSQGEIGRAYLEASAKAEIVGIMSTIRDILSVHCQTTLKAAMTRNIEKLRRRYPDGFDPERSLHRDE